MTLPEEREPSPGLEEAFERPSVPSALHHASPVIYKAADNYWRAAKECAELPPRMRELALLAMHASASALNTKAIGRQIELALNAGASERDVLDTLITIGGLANHALYSSIPILEDELKQLGIELKPAGPPAAYQRAKDRFIAARQFWTSDRDHLAQFIPGYLTALTELSVESWKTDALSPKERELICIAIDCTVNHTFESGLRTHIRNALGHGATPVEVLDILKLAGLLGLEGYILGATSLYGTT